MCPVSTALCVKPYSILMQIGWLENKAKEILCNLLFSFTFSKVKCDRLTVGNILANWANGGQGLCSLG